MGPSSGPLRGLLIAAAMLILLTACDEASTPEQTVTDAPSTVAAPEIPPVEVVDPEGTSRCERLGYTCSWGDVSPSDFDSATTLADEVQDIVDAAEDPESGIRDAAGMLAARGDISEILTDSVLHTSIMWRVGNLPLVVAYTELAGAFGDSSDYDGTPIDGMDTVELVALPNGANAVRASYHPAGGPIEPKRALVLDPFAEKADDCGKTLGKLLTGLMTQGMLDDDLKPDDCIKEVKYNRTEGARVAAIIGSHPQIDVTYLYGSEVTPWVVDDMSSYDLVHIVSHGGRACWGDKDYPPERDAGDGCVSSFLLGEVDYNPLRSDAAPPPGYVVSPGGRWAALSETLVGNFNADAIVYSSHCTSGDGGFARSGQYGSFVGISSYARVAIAERAAVEFWRLMAVEGVEFQLAIERLTAQKLHESFPINLGDIGHSRLVTDGKNLRARDVITTFAGAELANGSVLDSDGMVGDGVDDTLPEIRFEIEGVKDGTAGTTTVEVRIDGKKLKKTYNVESDGTLKEQKEGFAVWEVVADPFDLEFDLTYDDVKVKDPDKHTWESRVYQAASEYSAHEAKDLTLTGLLRAEGPIPFFEQLGDIPNVTLDENRILLEFRSSGGEAKGSFRAVISGSNNSGGVWEITFHNARYDAESGSLTADAVATAAGGGAGMFNWDSATGELNASVNVPSGVVNGSIALAGQTQPFTAYLQR